MGNTDEIINILYLGNKVRHLNTLEKYYIHLETKRNNQIKAKVLSAKTAVLTQQ